MAFTLFRVGLVINLCGPFEKLMMFTTTISVSSFILRILFCCCYLIIINNINNNIVIIIIIIIIINLVYYNVGACACISSSSRHLSHRDHIQIGSGFRPVSYPVDTVGSLPGNKVCGPCHKSPQSSAVVS
jgi:hypothetical protein